MRKLMTLVAVVLVAAAVVVLPAGAITNGEPDGNRHPMVGQLFFYVPDAIDPRFTDPGAWFNCTGTLISPTVVLTAGHCTFGVGLEGEPTTEDGGSGGNDVWVNFSPEPDYEGLPPSANYIPDDNEQRYLDRREWLNDHPDWIRGSAYPHPDYNDGAFVLADAGIVVLEEPVVLDRYAELPEVAELDEYLVGPKRDLFTAVGYGLNRSGNLPKHDEGGDIRYQATVRLVNLQGTFGIPDNTSVKFSSNSGKNNQGGTCFGDSGGPIFRAGTLEIVAVTSFGISSTCKGSSGGYRIDQLDDLNWIGSFLD